MINDRKYEKTPNTHRLEASQVILEVEDFHQIIKTYLWPKSGISYPQHLLKY